MRNRTYVLQQGRCSVDLHPVRGAHEHQAWLSERGYSRRTVALYSQTLRRADRFLAARGVTLATATASALHDFWLTVPATRSSRAGVRYALMSYYKSRGRPDGRPANELPTLPAPYRLPRPFSEDELRELLEAAQNLGGVYQVIGELLAYTGCRMCELRAAAWHQFDLGAQAVWYIEGKGARRRGPKQRQLPVHPVLRATLNRWRAAHPTAEWLFPSKRSVSGTLSDSTLRIYVGQIADEAGLENVPPHRWRHTVATVALDRTRDLRAVQEFLGHTSLASTQIYTAVIAGRLLELVESLPTLSP